MAAHQIRGFLTAALPHEPHQPPMVAPRTDQGSDTHVGGRGLLRRKHDRQQRHVGRGLGQPGIPCRFEDQAVEPPLDQKPPLRLFAARPAIGRRRHVADDEKLLGEQRPRRVQVAFRAVLGRLLDRERLEDAPEIEQLQHVGRRRLPHKHAGPGQMLEKPLTGQPGDSFPHRSDPDPDPAGQFVVYEVASRRKLPCCKELTNPIISVGRKRRSHGRVSPAKISLYVL